MIRAFVNFGKSKWYENIVDFEVDYNSVIQSGTGLTPFFVNYGIYPRAISAETLASPYHVASDFLQNIQQSMIVARDSINSRNKPIAKYANNERTAKEFAVRDKVWLSTRKLSIEDDSRNRKLHSKYCEVFEVTNKTDKFIVKLSLPQVMLYRKTHKAFHVSLLKRYFETKFGRNIEPLPPVRLEDRQEEIEATQILWYERKRGKITVFN